MKIVRNEPPATVPSARDSISMAFTNHDMFADGQSTQDIQFIAPCLIRWGVAPFQKVSNSSLYITASVYTLCEAVAVLILDFVSPAVFGCVFRSTSKNMHQCAATGA